MSSRSVFIPQLLQKYQMMLDCQGHGGVLPIGNPKLLGSLLHDPGQRSIVGVAHVRAQMMGDVMVEPAGEPTHDAGERRRQCPGDHVTSGQFVGRGRFESTGGGKWSGGSEQCHDLGDHDDDGRQPQRGPGVGPNVNRRTIEDVAEAQRSQRDDPARRRSRPRAVNLRWRRAITRLGGVTRCGEVTRRRTGIARGGVAGRWVTRGWIARWWVARWWVPRWTITGRRVPPLRVVGIFQRRAHEVESPSSSIMAPILSSTGSFLNVPRCLRAPASDRGAARSVSVMAELKSRLRSDLTDAMKAKDKLRTATLRMLLAAVQTEEVSGKEARELSDDEVLKVFAKESRKRGEAAEIYTQNGRGELAANEHAEARIIDEYLPTPLTNAEVADVADTAIAQVAEEIGERPGIRQMGLVMKAATALAAGKADGARLSAAVKDRL